MPKTQVNYTGIPQIINIPKEVEYIAIKAWGAGGVKVVDEKFISAAGGYSYGELEVKEAQTLKIYVGKSGGVINDKRIMSESTYVSFNDDKPFLIAAGEGELGFVDESILKNSKTITNKTEEFFPPNNYDSDYIRGLGQGAKIESGQVGGNGLVVVLFSFKVEETKHKENNIKQNSKPKETANLYKVVENTNKASVEELLKDVKAYDAKPKVSAVWTLKATQEVSKLVAGIGDIIRYSLTLKNEGNIKFENIIVSNNIGSYETLELIELNQDNKEININKGIKEIPLEKELNIGEKSTLTFSLKLIGPPRENPIKNFINIKYSYLDNGEVITKTIDANEVSTQIKYANLSRCIKFLDKRYLTVGETAVYTILIPNTGNTTAHNIMFKDTIPSGTTFVENSLRINGGVYYGSNPLKGLVIPDIGPGQTTTIAFGILAVG